MDRHACSAIRRLHGQQATRAALALRASWVEAAGQQAFAPWLLPLVLVVRSISDERIQHGRLLLFACCCSPRGKLVNGCWACSALLGAGLLNGPLCVTHSGGVTPTCGASQGHEVGVHAQLVQGVAHRHPPRATNGSFVLCAALCVASPILWLSVSGSALLSSASCRSRAVASCCAAPWALRTMDVCTHRLGMQPAHPCRLFLACSPCFNHVKNTHEGGAAAGSAALRLLHQRAQAAEVRLALARLLLAAR